MPPRWGGDPGDWAITPEIDFPGLSVRMRQPGHKPLIAIQAVEWADPDPLDGHSTLSEDWYLGGYRIFPERTEPGGTVYDRVAVRVTIDPRMPVGFSDTVHFQVFDPDYYVDGGQADTPEDGDPNDNEPGMHRPDDNFGGVGISPTRAELEFASGQWEQSVVLRITEPQPGNNFVLAAHHSRQVLDRYHFHDDEGKNLWVTDQGREELIVPPHRSDNWLTVWRTLWMELDDMVAPDPAPEPRGGGPFDGAGVGNDDVYLDPPIPLIALAQNELQWGLIEVKALPAEHNNQDAMPGDGTGTLEFRHNLASLRAANFLGAVRDVASERYFWVIHTVGAYEEEIRDYDPNGSVFMIGYAYGMMTDESNAIFFETVRDVAANCPAAVARETIEGRIVLHEALHRFLGPHGAPGADEGVMVVEPNLLTGSVQQNRLTPRQTRLINAKDYPGNPT